jgi:hypothetical protein
MVDYTSNFDPAPTSSGPFLHFYSKASEDIPAGAWGLRDGGTTTAIDLSKGFVLDWPTARTGWVQALGIKGVAPLRQWNVSRARFEPRPPGDKWRKGFSVAVAYATDAFATWEQSGAGIWKLFSFFFTELMETAPARLPLLPLIIPIGATLIKFAQGSSVVPKFQVSKYLPRPRCLPEDKVASSQIDPQTEVPSPVTYSCPPANAAPAQTATPQPSAQPPTRPAPIQPAGWDEPETPPGQESAPPSMASKDGIPIPRQEPPHTQSDGPIDSDPGF